MTSKGDYQWVPTPVQKRKVTTHVSTKLYVRCPTNLETVLRCEFPTTSKLCVDPGIVQQGSVLSSSGRRGTDFENHVQMMMLIDL